MIRALFRPLHLGRLFGVPVRGLPVVFLIMILLVVSIAGRNGSVAAGQVIGLLGLLTLSLLVHELAHALTAKRCGLYVQDILIGPLGGVARVENAADRPLTEALVAAAGPLANLLLAALFVLIPGGVGDAGVWINLVLGLGNLLPAFPLDGGRVLRAWLARHSPLVDATRAAVAWANWVMVLGLIACTWYGLFLVGLVVMVYLYAAGRTELLQAMLREGTDATLTPGQVLMRAWRGADDC